MSNVRHITRPGRAIHFSLRLAPLQMVACWRRYEFGNYLDVY